MIASRAALLARIREMPDTLPISDQVQSSPRFASHRHHWISWLEGYDGPGAYGRQNPDRDARFVYNHLQNPGMLVWLAEGAGVNRVLVEEAARDAKGFNSCNLSRISAGVRRLVPWSEVSRSLWPDLP